MKHKGSTSHIGRKKNTPPEVVTRPTNSNRSLNTKVTPSLHPSNPNRSLNAPARVKPSHGKGY